jgi:hypothetical protein
LLKKIYNKKIFTLIFSENNENYFVFNPAVPQENHDGRIWTTL